MRLFWAKLFPSTLTIYICRAPDIAAVEAIFNVFLTRGWKLSPYDEWKKHILLHDDYIHKSEAMKR